MQKLILLPLAAFMALSFIPIIAQAQAVATGEIVFLGNPSDRQTLTINGTVFTFFHYPPGLVANEIQIEVNPVDTTTNTIIALQNASEPGVQDAVYSQTDPDAIRVAYGIPGAVGNAFTLNTNSIQISVSGATLVGGEDSCQGLACSP